MVKKVMTPEASLASAREAGLTGYLSCLSVFEVLQTLQYFRKPGELWLENEDPLWQGAREAVCTLGFGGLVSAVCGHLRDREAVFAALWWKLGRFAFKPVEKVSGEEKESVEEILLDAVRLADENEARREVVGDLDEPLTLCVSQRSAHLRELPASFEIASFLAERPGARRSDLEAALPFAPITVAYALGRLAEEGWVAEVDSRGGGSPRSGGAGAAYRGSTRPPSIASARRA